MVVKVKNKNSSCFMRYLYIVSLIAKKFSQNQWIKVKKKVKAEYFCKVSTNKA